MYLPAQRTFSVRYWWWNFRTYCIRKNKFTYRQPDYDDWWKYEFE